MLLSALLRTADKTLFTMPISALGRPRGAPCARADVARRCVMSELALLLDEYLATRRALGNRLELPGRNCT